MSKNVDLTISINRVTGGDEETPIRIEVNDGVSRTRLLHVRMTLEDFSRAVTGQGFIKAKGEFYDDMPTGCTRENKEELVPQPRYYGRDKKEAEDILAPFEVDGWKARPDDIFNPHRWCGDDKVRVIFTRYINPDGSVWQAQSV